jgi:type IV pilus assembly protein PilP
MPLIPTRARLLLLLPLLLLAACNEEQQFQDLQDFINHAGEGLRGQKDSSLDVQPYEPVVFENLDKLPDPFKPHKPKHTGGSGHALSLELLQHRKQPLEEFPLEGLKMVAFLNMHDAINAVVRAPDGKLHDVKVGAYLGQNYGQVVAISETEIQIKEVVQDGEGDWQERTNRLQLSE